LAPSPRNQLGLSGPAVLVINQVDFDPACMQALLPPGAFFNGIDSTDVRMVYALEWTPEVGQEGTWQLCFSTSDSLFISTEIRSVPSGNDLPLDESPP